MLKNITNKEKPMKWCVNSFKIGLLFCWPSPYYAWLSNYRVHTVCIILESLIELSHVSHYIYHIYTTIYCF